MTDENTEKTSKTPKHRSPNYPSISLEEGLKRIQALQGQGATKHFIPLSVAFDVWGYKAGAGNQVAAALKAYGLADFEGKTDKRQIRLSESARRILLDAPEKEELLKTAALKPALHAELWQKYEGDPPADAVIKQHLLLDRDFNPNFVDAFISQLRDTIAYAGLSASDKLDTAIGEDEEDDESISGMDTIEESTTKKSAKVPLPPAPKGQLPFPLYLSKTQQAMLYVPASLTRKEYDLLRKQIDNSFSVMEATILSDDTPEETEN